VVAQGRKSAGKKRRKRESPIVSWGKRVNWERRVKAVCKPCWELKYCPYGPLVEDFPLKETRDEMSCRIFGHDCPVFHVAEPFTETKQLRNISRTIPRSVQFRVLKRENQICSVCGGSVQDQDIEFDHVIPWSKGGSSDEANVRLLCRPCNRKRRADFEKEFLIEGLGEHLAEPVDEFVVKWLLCVVSFGLAFEESEGRFPSPKDYAEEFGDGKTPGPEDQEAWTFATLKEFFAGKPPTDLPHPVFQALKLRWGCADGSIRPLKVVAQETGRSVEELIAAERDLLRRLGWFVKTTKAVERKWRAL
jgi:hypothetical protein